MLAKKIMLLMFFSPLMGVISLICVPSTKENNKLLKVISLNCSFLTFFLSLCLWLLFKKSTGLFQFSTYVFSFPGFNANFMLGVDGISLFFLILTTLLVPLCILASWDLQKNLKEFLILFLLLEFFLIGSFCAIDLLFFYIFFESVLIPMFLIIGIWGSRERKILAAYYFFLYTLSGSILMLFWIVYLSFFCGTSEYEILLLLTTYLSWTEQLIIWCSFFLAFASKVPMIPVHLWLPEAHVEAPTAGSVILAGILLKLGTYGFIRFSLPLFPSVSLYCAPFVYSLSVVGVIYASFTAIRQTDFKRIIAYTSIAHMNLVVIGIFSFNYVGLEGSILQSLSHGFVASALFLIIGVVYERYKTRLVKYYGGLVSVMPIYVTIFLFFTVANISFPGTSSFVGELLILIGIFKINSTITFISALSVIIGGAYSLWLFNRISFGNLKNQYTVFFFDLTFRELVIFIPLILGTLLLGLYPKFFSDYINCSLSLLIELLK